MMKLEGRSRRSRLAMGALLLGAGVGASGPPASAQETYRMTGSSLAVYNLAGRVEVVRGSGSQVVVTVTRGGADADRLEVEVGEVRGRESLRVIYPSNQIVYPSGGRGQRAELRVRSDGTFGSGSGGERVTIRGSGRGLEAHADLRIEVPDGKDLAVHLAAGNTEARGIRGDLLVDTGSGGVTVEGVTGNLTVDTGSGTVRVGNVEGDVLVDTGSGSVTVEGVRGESLVVDTGSGSVQGSDLSAGSVRVDTGSGTVILTAVASPDVSVDTGSGSVELDLTRDVDRLDVDTGSGSVTVRFSSDVGADLEVETGSGRIDVDFPVELRVMRRDHIEGRLGDGAGRIRIGTGSGRVRLTRG